jgi:hypothetical protein
MDEVVIACFKILLQQLPGMTQGTHGKPKSVSLIFRPRFESWTSRI